MKVFFPPAVYLSHGDGEGREEEGWTSGREGEQSKADTHTSAGQQFTAPHQTPHVRRDKSRDGVTEGEEKRKSSGERKELCQKTKQNKKKKHLRRGEIQSPSSACLSSALFFVLFPTAGNICENDGKQSGKLFPTINPPTLPPSVAAELDS